MVFEGLILPYRINCPLVSVVFPVWLLDRVPLSIQESTGVNVQIHEKKKKGLLAELYEVGLYENFFGVCLHSLFSSRVNDNLRKGLLLTQGMCCL